jgi:hypothetical protein
MVREFQQKILPSLPIEELCKHYHDWNGRPIKVTDQEKTKQKMYL